MVALKTDLILGIPAGANIPSVTAGPGGGCGGVEPSQPGPGQYQGAGEGVKVECIHHWKCQGDGSAVCKLCHATAKFYTNFYEALRGGKRPRGRGKA